MNEMIKYLSTHRDLSSKWAASSNKLENVAYQVSKTIPWRDQHLQTLTPHNV